MPEVLNYTPRPARDFPDWKFETLNLGYDAATRSVWMSYKAEGPPYYSFQTLMDMADVRESLRGLIASPYAAEYPVDYFVMASDKPDIFSLGGDLEMFALAIEAGDEGFLRHYAHACIDVVYGLAHALDGAFVSLAVIEGQALGGGLEAALGQDYLLADENARLGVPEIVFNTFPGMGGVTHLSRRLGSARASEFILSGRAHGGADMYEAGVVDILAPAGQGRKKAMEWMAEGGKAAHARRLALAETRRRLYPVRWEELIEITDVWVSCALDVTETDVRHMRRLAAAQKRKLAAG